MVTLRPHGPSVVGWAAFAMVALGLGVFLAVRFTDLFTVVFAAVALVVAAYYLAQAVAPGQFRVDMDATGIRGQWLWHRLQIPWVRIGEAKVVHVAGESVLQLRLDTGQETSLLLPVGADVAALHQELAAHLGQR